jgi:hypothetical protein
MLHRVVSQIVRELNEDVSTRVPGSRRARVVACRFVDSNGQARPEVRDRLVVQVVNLDQPAGLRPAEPRGERSPSPPPTSLIVLVAAHLDDYMVSLEALALVVDFFTSRPVFVADDGSRARVELYPLTIEQQSLLWATLGVAYIPSVTFKVVVTAAGD